MVYSSMFVYPTSSEAAVSRSLLDEEPLEPRVVSSLVAAPQAFIRLAAVPPLLEPERPQDTFP